MEDHLANLTAEELAAWYGRLADKTAQNKWGGTEQLASKCLRIWLDNRTHYATITVEAPYDLLNSPDVFKALTYHRRVYLTQEKARLTSGLQWAGIVPRFQGMGRPRAATLKGITMDYESLVEMPITAQVFGPAEDKDLLYALHGLQLKTEVTLSCSLQTGSNLVQAVFVSFQAKMKNRYDWNPERKIRVSNPDFRKKGSQAVAPKEKVLVVDNRHAKRLEEAGLAAPYYLESDTWFVDSSLCVPAQVDPAKSLT